jgi:2-polyprenyl-6-hydroxyphenyl methylase/3-demethylubiquinone-9 3-methyltransferase
VAHRHAATEEFAIDYVGSLAEGLPFADGAFDAVVTADTLEHVEDVERVIAEAARVLKPGGQFVYDTVNRTWKSRLLLVWLPQRIFRIAPPDTHDYHRFVRPEELRALLRRHGLTNCETRGLALRRHPVAAGISYARTRRLGGFVLGNDQGMSYVGYAVKAEPGSSI